MYGRWVDVNDKYGKLWQHVWVGDKSFVNTGVPNRNAIEFYNALRRDVPTGAVSLRLVLFKDELLGKRSKRLGGQLRSTALGLTWNIDCQRTIVATSTRGHVTSKRSCIDGTGAHSTVLQLHNLTREPISRPEALPRQLGTR